KEPRGRWKPTPRCSAPTWVMSRHRHPPPAAPEREKSAPGTDLRREASVTAPCAGCRGLARRRGTSGGTLGFRTLARRRRASGRAALARGRRRLFRQGGFRRSGVRLALQRRLHGARAPGGYRLFPVLVARLVRARGTRPGLLRCRAFFRRRQIDARAARFRKPYRNGLLGRAGAVLAFTDMVHFLANEFSRLRGRCLSFTLVFRGALQRFPFGHGRLR